MGILLTKESDDNIDELGEKRISINLPKHKKYFISYVKLTNVQNGTYSFRNKMDLSTVFTENVIINSPFNLIYGSIIYKLKMIGFWTTPLITEFYINDKKPLNEILENIKTGFLVSDCSDTFDIFFKLNCYYPTIQNIKYLINEGNILIAGIIIDSQLINGIVEIFNSNIKIDLLHKSEISSDIIIILGYDESGLIIRTSWFNEPMNITLNYKFLDNIKEIWNITINNSLTNNNGN